MIKHIIFDFDGTISNSEKAVKDSFEYALSKFGLTADRKTLDKVIGPPLSESFKDFYGLRGADITAAVKYYRDYHDVYGINEYKMYDGFDKLLNAVRKSGKKTYIATSKPIEYTERILLNFGIYELFDFIAGNNIKEERPDKQSVIKYLLDSCRDIKKNNAVMVGDRKYDIIGAHSFLLPAIGVEYGFAPAGELTEYKADYIVTSVEALKELLLSL